jgi:hypothetical protein
VTASRRSRDLVAAAVSLAVGGGLAVYLVLGHHPWDSSESMPVGPGEGIHPSDFLAIIPLVVGLGLAVWFVWRGRRSTRSDGASPGVHPTHRR